MVQKKKLHYLCAKHNFIFPSCDFGVKYESGMFWSDSPRETHIIITFY